MDKLVQLEQAQIQKMKKKCLLVKYVTGSSKNLIQNAHIVELFSKKRKKKFKKNHPEEARPDHLVEDPLDQRGAEDRLDQRRVEDPLDQREAEDQLDLKNLDHLVEGRPDQRRVEDHPDPKNLDHLVEDHLGPKNLDHLAEDRLDQRRAVDRLDPKSLDHPVEDHLDQRRVEGHQKEDLQVLNVAHLDEGRSYEQKSQ
jgi:hypothetical protein